MNFYSIRNRNINVSFREAVIKGIADDGGLFMPQSFPALHPQFISGLSKKSIQEITYEISSQFIDDISANDLQTIIEQTFTFDAPLISVDSGLFFLELFHGPTLAFKDFGARFLANILSYYSKSFEKELIILVATSGDTGSAVGNAFLGKQGIKVGLLYPSGMVSTIQEKQLTTMGQNVIAFEVEGTFDDCQRMVKQAFSDPQIKSQYFLSSANSINIARLIPQSFYYFRAYGQLGNSSKVPVFCVPSGNLGNLTAGILAAKMGLPVKHFISAVNTNQSFSDYIKDGSFKPRKAVKTISNAMDVGDPSNFYRVIDLFRDKHSMVKENISTFSVSDAQTKIAIKQVYDQYDYVIDPHGAVGFQAIEDSQIRMSSSQPVINLLTAHPAKFADILQDILPQKIEPPEHLKRALSLPKQSTKIPASLNDLRYHLFSV